MTAETQNKLRQSYISIRPWKHCHYVDYMLTFGQKGLIWGFRLACTSIVVRHINLLTLTFDLSLWTLLWPDVCKFFPKHLAVISIHLWSMKVMLRYDFLFVNGLLRHNKPCCDLYRHAEGHHDSSTLSFHLMPDASVS
jgi:hypothetical protein